MVVIGNSPKLADLRRAAHHEQMRDLLAVHIFDGRANAGRASGLNRKATSSLSISFLVCFNVFRRAVGIVVGDQVDFPPVDTAAVVDRIDVGDESLAVLLSGEAGR